MQDFLDSLRGLGFGMLNVDQENLDKLNEDRYEVYVNDDLVGYKTLKTQNEHITGIDSFLHTQGFTSFSSELQGDHYMINAHEDDAPDMKDALEAYFHNR